jgi:hypothetical protein
MARTVVWKHVLTPGRTDVELPIAARVLHVAAQNDDIYLWEAHDAATTRTETRYFIVLGTGFVGDFDLSSYSGTRHVGTVLMYDARIVLHVFEVTHG